MSTKLVKEPISKDQISLLKNIQLKMVQLREKSIDGVADRETRQDLDALLTVANNYIDNVLL